MELYGRLCGWTLARAHARSGDRDRDRRLPRQAATSFDRAIADFAERLRRPERARLRGTQERCGERTGSRRPRHLASPARRIEAVGRDRRPQRAMRHHSSRSSDAGVHRATDASADERSACIAARLRPFRAAGRRDGRVDDLGTDGPTGAGVRRDRRRAGPERALRDAARRRRLRAAGELTRLFVGPSAGVATLSASSVALVATTGTDSAKYIALTVALTLMVGVLYIAGGLARMGFVARFFARPVLDGFIVGLGLYIAISQLPKVVGIVKPRATRWRCSCAHRHRHRPLGVVDGHRRGHRDAGTVRARTLRTQAPRGDHRGRGRRARDQGTRLGRRGCVSARCRRALSSSRSRASRGAT